MHANVKNTTISSISVIFFRPQPRRRHRLCREHRAVVFHGQSKKWVGEADLGGEDLNCHSDYSTNEQHNHILVEACWARRMRKDRKCMVRTHIDAYIVLGESIGRVTVRSFAHGIIEGNLLIGQGAGTLQ